MKMKLNWLKIALIGTICHIHLAYGSTERSALSKKELPCHFGDSVNITDGKMSSLLGSIVYKGVTYTKEDYAEIDYILTDFYTVKVYVKPYLRGCMCNIKTCIRYCCQTGEMCEDSEEILVNSTAFNEIGQLETVDIKKNEDYSILFLHNEKPCSKMFRLEPEKDYEDSWQFMKNGSIFAPSFPKVFDSKMYCLINSSITEPTIGAICCYDSPNKELRYTTYPIGMLVSVPFLLATFFVYACIPELRNVHGKSLMCYVTGLTGGYVSLIITNFADFEGSTPECKTFGYITYFSFLVSFFWLNVMCFDIWWTFRGVRSKGSERKKFIFYSIYGWGAPIAMLSFALFMDYADVVPIAAKPRFGIRRCLIIDEKLIEFLYLYLPILILVFINIVFFSITAAKIFRVYRETSMVRKGGDSKKHSKMDSDKERFWLYLRLFIVMGVTWSMEFISWAVGGAIWIFYISDICNCIQGFLIFLLFVWKQKVKRLIWKKFGLKSSTAEGSTMLRSSTRTTDTSISVRPSTDFSIADPPKMTIK